MERSSNETIFAQLPNHCHSGFCHQLDVAPQSIKDSEYLLLDKCQQKICNFSPCGNCHVLEICSERWFSQMNIAVKPVYHVVVKRIHLCAACK